MFKKILQSSLIVISSFLVRIDNIFAQTQSIDLKEFNNRLQPAYGIRMNEPTPLGTIISIVSLINVIIFYIIAPIVFIVGLIKYILGKKQKNIIKQKKGKKIMLIGVIIAVISIALFIIWQLSESYIYEKLI